MRKRFEHLGLLAVATGTLLVVAGGCSAPQPAPSIDGLWRLVLDSPGGELPTTLEISVGSEGYTAVVHNGGEEAPTSAVEVDGNAVVIRFDFYDAELTGTLNDAHDRIEGRWRRTAAEGDSALDFFAARGVEHRFEGSAPDPDPDPGIDGEWSMLFTDEDGTEGARGVFRSEGRRVLGTILTPTGDYRFLEGDFDGQTLRLSTFDGAHAFLFDAKLDGERLEGNFFSRDTYHATWTAERIEAGTDLLTDLGDPFAQVELLSEDGRFDFSFPDLEGNVVSASDAQFAGNVVLVEIFGSWCPNCNDAAPLLAEWHDRYAEAGLRIVGLAYEMRGDFERDREFVAKFRDRYGIEFPLLIAGTSDKAAAAETLPIDRVLSFPTAVFIDRSGKVRKIYSGFTGPSTGHHFDELRAEHEAILEELLAEAH